MYILGWCKESLVSLHIYHTACIHSRFCGERGGGGRGERKQEGREGGKREGRERGKREGRERGGKERGKREGKGVYPEIGAE